MVVGPGAWGQAANNLMAARNTTRKVGCLAGIVICVLCVVGALVFTAVVLPRISTPVRPAPGRSHR